MDSNRFWKNVAYFFVGVAIVAALYLLFLRDAHAQQFQGQTQNTLSTSASNSTSNSESVSGASANSNQQQGQTVTSNLGAQQGNAQSITFNTQQRRTTQVDTNAAVPLAASVSFSSDYCGGVASGGASAAGISIGASKPFMDGNCQSMRRAEKFGVMAVTARNMGQNDWAEKLLAMSIWELCTSESNSAHGASSKRGTSGVPSTQAGCLHLGLVTPDDMEAVDAMPVKAAARAASDAEQAAAAAAVDQFKAGPGAPPLNPGAAVIRPPGT